MRHPIVIVDTETTGFDAPAPIEIAALRLSPAWTITGAFYRRWQPAKPVEPEAANVNGYTPEAWALCEHVNAADLSAFGEFVAGHQWAGSFPDYDFRTLEPDRIGARLPEWDLATHRKIDVGTLGAPACLAVGSKFGLEGILSALAGLGRHTPPLREWLAHMADGRTGPHTAMGDAWETAWALRCLWQPVEEYWRGEVARAA